MRGVLSMSSTCGVVKQAYIAAFGQRGGWPPGHLKPCLMLQQRIPVAVAVWRRTVTVQLA